MGIKAAHEINNGFKHTVSFKLMENVLEVCSHSVILKNTCPANSIRLALKFYNIKGLVSCQETDFFLKTMSVVKVLQL